MQFNCVKSSHESELVAVLMEAQEGPKAVGEKEKCFSLYRG